MPTQTYETHRHNPRLTGIGFLFLVIAVVGLVFRWVGIGGRVSFAVGLAAILATNMVLLLISRGYTTRLQDRIIKLEMRARCAPLLTPGQHAIFMKLPTPQIVALRFASDEELPALIERTDRDRLTPDQIKRAIKHWVPDWDRT